MHAAEIGALDAVTAVLQAGANANTATPDGTTSWRLVTNAAVSAALIWM
jgi:hypothetical protein